MAFAGPLRMVSNKVLSSSPCCTVDKFQEEEDVVSGFEEPLSLLADMAREPTCKVTCLYDYGQELDVWALLAGMTQQQKHAAVSQADMDVFLMLAGMAGEQTYTLDCVKELVIEERDNFQGEVDALLLLAGMASVLLQEEKDLYEGSTDPLFMLAGMASNKEPCKKGKPAEEDDGDDSTTEGDDDAADRDWTRLGSADSLDFSRTASGSLARQDSWDSHYDDDSAEEAVDVFDLLSGMACEETYKITQQKDRDDSSMSFDVFELLADMCQDDSMSFDVFELLADMCQDDSTSFDVFELLADMCRDDSTSFDVFELLADMCQDDSIAGAMDIGCI